MSTPEFRILYRPLKFGAKDVAANIEALIDPDGSFRTHTVKPDTFTYTSLIARPSAYRSEPLAVGPNLSRGTAGIALCLTTKLALAFA